MTAGATAFEHEGLALAVAAKYARYASPSCGRADLEQASRIAVCRAVQRYDADKGVKLITYAWRAAERACVRTLHNDRHTVRLPVYRYARGDRPKPARSLDAPVHDDSSATHLDMLADGAPLADEQLDANERRARLDAAITAALLPRQAAIVRGRLAGKTLVEIGAGLGGLSRERCRQIEVEAIAALRAALA